MSHKRDIDQLVKRVRETGTRVEKSGRAAHWKVFAPGGMVFISQTPGSPRCIQAAISDLRRNGVQV